jgi:uncharacterized membrane protein YozB (DUF420 family)
MDVRDLPALNASLNATAAALLITGYRLIRQGRREAHGRVMLAAFSVSALFLVSYLVYHFQIGSVKFQKTGPIRAVYLTILLTHTVLATGLPILAIVTIRRAWLGGFASHARLARYTLPIWLYVSVTGVIVYWMLYRM